MRIIPKYWLCRVLLRCSNKRWCADLDKTGNALTLDGATFSAQTTLNNGTNTIPFEARYYAIGTATSVLLMRMRPSGSVSITYLFAGTSLRADAHLVR